jgi:uncharacterized protein
MKEAAASPLIVGVTEQLRRLGTRKHGVVDAEVSGLELSSARVPDGAEVHVDVMLEAIAHASVTATGEVTAPWEGECRRCLGTVEGTRAAKVQEVFEAHPVEGDTYPLDQDHVDLEPMVRDVVLLHLPLAPLCSEGCAGPAPDVLPVVVPADDDPDLAERPKDPRWAGLEGLRFD